ncbi:MAG: hypothetical protein PHO76_02555 [Methylotenera sp.]|nr:hypothetical protein [Methylotenera sp.]
MKNLLLLVALLPSLAFADALKKPADCEASIGKKNSAILVSWCLETSPSTHPPCNSKNACFIITNEIRRGCSFLINDTNAPFYCLITTDLNPQ